MNGVPIEEKYLTPEDFEEQLLTVIMKETQVKFQFGLMGQNDHH